MIIKIFVIRLLIFYKIVMNNVFNKENLIIILLYIILIL